MNAVRSILHLADTSLIIEVECNLSNGLPIIIIVGLGNKSVDEAKERIRSAFAHSKIEFPRKRIVINLAPADVPKDSASFDLAIAVAILQAVQKIKSVREKDAFIGELGLDGNVRAVRGIIGKIIGGKNAGIDRFFIPIGNLAQANLVPGIKIVPVESLKSLHTMLSEDSSGAIVAQKPTSAKRHETAQINQDVFNDISGQEQAKRALKIAAAGGHNILLSGPPGTGKSMLAKALPSLLPPLDDQEMLEVTHLHSLGSSDYDRLITERPFRSPHHSASLASIIGGGSRVKPGEASLSHCGVLFLDELPEFSRDIIEALRQPLEDKTVEITRAHHRAVFPANFILVATANPCPCGYYGTTHACSCSPSSVLRYRQRMSGPILDRIDLHVTVDSVEHRALLQASTSNNTLQSFREHILLARKAQVQRNGKFLNAALTNKMLKECAQLEPEARALLIKAAERLSISARSYIRVIKVARTIADLEQSSAITCAHITEALQYRFQNIE